MTGLSLAEQQFAQWVEARGLSVTLCIERRCDDGRHHSVCMDYDPAQGWTQAEDALMAGWRVYLSEGGLEEVEEVT